MRDRIVAMGSRRIASMKVAEYSPTGTKSSELSDRKSREVIADKTALQARLTTWGKHLDATSLVIDMLQTR
jgi:hypothetical protein